MCESANKKEANTCGFLLHLDGRMTIPLVPGIQLSVRAVEWEASTGVGVQGECDHLRLEPVQTLDLFVRIRIPASQPIFPSLRSITSAAFPDLCDWSVTPGEVTGNNCAFLYGSYLSPLVHTF